MEWWEKQDRLESEGWKFKNGLLHWPDGGCSPLVTSLSPERQVEQAWEFVELLKRNSPNLAIWSRYVEAEPDSTSATQRRANGR